MVDFSECVLTLHLVLSTLDSFRECSTRDRKIIALCCFRQIAFHLSIRFETSKKVPVGHLY